MSLKTVVAIIAVSILSVAMALAITFIFGNSTGRQITQAVSTPISPIASLARPTAANNPPPAATAIAADTTNCTFPISIWLQNPSIWQIDSYRIGRQNYTRERLIELLSSPSMDTRSSLLAQSIAVVLNQHHGADVTAIRNSFSESIDWLAAFPVDVIPTAGELARAENLSQTLEAFNTGRSGPDLCPYPLSQVTPAATPTTWVETSSTPSSSPSPAQFFPTSTSAPAERPAPPPTARPPAPTAPPQPPTQVSPPVPSLSPDQPTLVPEDPTLPPPTNIP